MHDTKKNRINKIVLPGNHVKINIEWSVATAAQARKRTLHFSNTLLSAPNLQLSPNKSLWQQNRLVAR